MFDLPDHTILDGQKQLFNRISPLVTTISKYILRMYLLRDVLVSDEVLSSNIQDFLLYTYLPVLDILLALNINPSFFLDAY